MKKTGVAYVIWLILGLIGGHRYYLGRWVTGLLMTVTIGGAGVWWLIDAFLLPGLVRSANGAMSIRTAPDESVVPAPALSPATAGLIPEEGIPVPWSSTGFIREHADGHTQLRVNSEAEARLAIKDIQSFKKQLLIERKQMTQQMASQRAARQQNLAQRGSTMRGGGNFGQFVRALDAVNRDATRRAHANQLAPLQEQKQLYDQAINEMDLLINQVERETLRLKTSKTEGWQSGRT